MEDNRTTDEILASINQRFEKVSQAYEKVSIALDRSLERRNEDLKGASKMSESGLTAKEIKALQEQNEQLKKQIEELTPVDTSLEARQKSRRSLREIAKDVKAEHNKMKTFSKIEQAKNRYK